MAVSAFSQARAYRDVAEINITPLVDVMLVLLVIFMVTTPMLSYPIELRLPQATPLVPLDPPERLRLEVTAGGEYLLRGERLSRAQLGPALAAEVARHPRLLVELDANADADYQSVAAALAALRNRQVDNVSLSD